MVIFFPSQHIPANVARTRAVHLMEAAICMGKTYDEVSLYHLRQIEIFLILLTDRVQ